MSHPILSILSEGKAAMRVHLIGVAGSGMSGIAALLMELGHQVSGSDKVRSAEVDRLENKGLTFTSPHTAESVADADMVVYSTAIKAGNAAYDASVAADLPLVRRAEALAAILHRKKGIVVAGTHGKTTTSALLAHVLRLGGVRPSHYVGAEIPVLGSNAHWDHEGEHFVAEGDESDGTLVNFHPHHSILLNAEAEHLDFYDSFEEIAAVFGQLADQTSGNLYYCGEDEGACGIAEKAPCTVSYGRGDAFDYSAEILHSDGSGSRFTVRHNGKLLGEAHLGVPGEHNVLNALAALAVATDLGVPFDRIGEALTSFRGARRRFEVKYQSADYVVVDDYGHHPTEILATLNTARGLGRKRLLCLFQPHRYSRTQLLKKDFAVAFDDADALFVTDVYPASERPLPGVTGQTITDEMVPKENQEVHSVPDLTAARLQLGNTLQPGDLVMTLGAGNIHEQGTALARDLETLDDLRAALGDDPGKVKLYEPMARHSTMRIGGPAQFWIEPHTVEGFSRVVALLRTRAIPIRVVGRGSNLLVRDGGIPGAVIHPSKGEFAEVKINGDTLHAGVGARLKKVSSAARIASLGGFEWMEGIPGNVGGSIRMNAGAMGTETFDQVLTVTYLDPAGELREKPVAEITHHYRNVPEFTENYIVSASFKGSPAALAEIDTRLEASRAKRKTSQPIAASAGCIFKNPEALPAGQLVEQLGFKERRVGAAEVSDVHGNFIVNTGGATAADVLGLIEQITEEALAERGIELQPEVQILGTDNIEF